MIINTYKKYILNLFTKTLIEVILIFFALILIINLFEEINFLKNENVSVFYPVFLSLLNTPSVIFDILPFIFLVSTIFFFIKLMDKNELFIFKYSGITNSRILSILVLCAFFIGVIIIFGFCGIDLDWQEQKIESAIKLVITIRLCNIIRIPPVGLY